MNRAKIIKKYIKGKQILDLGSAGYNNYLHKELQKEIIPKIIGVDIEKNEQVDVIADLNKEFPFDDSSQDTIIASEVIEHLETPFNLIRESYRILKKGGILVLSTPNPTGLPQILNEDKSKDILQISSEQLKKSVKKVGFEIVDYFRPMEAYRFNLLYKLITFIFPKLRITQFIICKK